MPLFVVVALAGDVGNGVFREIPVALQKRGEGRGGCDARNNPERVAEEVAMALGGEREAAVQVVSGNEVEETAHIVLMDETSLCHAFGKWRSVKQPVPRPGAEEFTELEELAVEILFEVVGEDFAVVSAKVFFSIVARSSFFMAGLRANP